MIINWTRCSEQMPPNNHDMQLIAKSAHAVKKVNAGFLHWRIPHYERHKIEWTPYTEEAWKELNK